jgi:hypothetical protein
MTVDRTWRCTRFAVAALAGPSTLLLILYVFGAPRNPGVWNMVLFFLAFLLFSLAWTLSFRVRICGETLEYRSLFGGRKSLKLSQIQSAKVEAEGIGFQPDLRLEVVPKVDAGLRPFSINLRVFGPRDVGEFLDEISSVVPVDWGDHEEIEPS